MLLGPNGSSMVFVMATFSPSLRPERPGPSEPSRPADTENVGMNSFVSEAAKADFVIIRVVLFLDIAIYCLPLIRADASWRI